MKRFCGVLQYKAFYRVTNSHRRANNIEILNINGVASKEARMIQKNVANFFKYS